MQQPTLRTNDHTKYNNCILVIKMPITKCQMDNSEEGVSIFLHIHVSCKVATNYLLRNAAPIKEH